MTERLCVGHVYLARGAALITGEDECAVCAQVGPPSPLPPFPAFPRKDKP